ncbi:MAG: DASH family cryptochrome [Flavobacteriaceae bacterium]
MQQGKGNAIVWLRNDLRAQDHYGFSEATKHHDRVVAFFSFDPRQFEQTPWGFKKTEHYRATFLLETVAELQKELKQYNIPLIIETKQTEASLPQWIDQLKVDTLYFQKEWTSEEKNVEKELKKKINDRVNIVSYYDQFLFHPDDLPIAIENLPKVFTVFRKKCEKYCSVRDCFPSPITMPKENDTLEKFTLPKLEELGLTQKKQHPQAAFSFKGGSHAALERLKHYFWNTKKLSFYKQTRNGLLGQDYSSKFSAWLANGSISARQIYWQIKAYEKQIDKNQSTYWLIFELIWRDYFKYVSLKHRNKIFQLGGILERQYHWKNNPQVLKAWIDGQTKEPFVNANMKELSTTGWMSNRGRQNVASYFAKNLNMDWRLGAAYFEAMLIDYDVHSNYGNWMYVAGVGNDPRDRKFNVRLQAERYDENGKYQRLWLQESLFE